MKGFFGFRPSKDLEATDLAAIRRDFSSFLIEPSDDRLPGTLVKYWSWLDLPKTPPVLVSAFGDLFFRTPDGVIMLDTLEGALTNVGRNIREFRGKLDQDDGPDWLFNSIWVQAARRRGLFLEPHECYEWKVHPIIGGEVSRETIIKMSLDLKLSITGQLHEQVRRKPPGFRITGFVAGD